MVDFRQVQYAWLRTHDSTWRLLQGLFPTLFIKFIFLGEYLKIMAYTLFWDKLFDELFYDIIGKR